MHYCHAHAQVREVSFSPQWCDQTAERATTRTRALRLAHGYTQLPDPARRPVPARGRRHDQQHTHRPCRVAAWPGYALRLALPRRGACG
jgi:hypothetical protein